MNIAPWSSIFLKCHLYRISLCLNSIYTVIKFAKFVPFEMRGGCCMFIATQSVISWPIGEFSRLSKCEARLLRTPLVPTGVAGQIKKKKIGRRYSYTQLDSQQVWVWGEQEEQESWSWLFESLASLWAAEASLLQARVRVRVRVGGRGVGVGGFQSSHPCLHQSRFAGDVCWFLWPNLKRCSG